MWGLGISILYIMICFVSVYGCSKIYMMEKEDVRKIFHIEMANWWWVRILFFDEWFWACLGPLLFIGINFVYEKSKCDKKFGMVQFAFSLFLCVLYSFGSRKNLVYGTIAMMILGWADPIAALVGRRFNPAEKTWQGTVGFIVTSFIILQTASCLGYLQENFLGWILMAVILGIIEAKVLPKLDNLLLPLFTIGILHIVQG